MKRTRIGLVGCGDVAQRDYLPEFHRIAGRVELVGVCGLSPERAQQTADKYSIAGWYPDYQTMLSSADVELVLNLTPIQVHADVTKACLEAGCHVYSEKPLASTVAAAAELRDLAAQRGLVLACAPSVVLQPQVRLLASLLDEGRLGPIHWARGLAHGGVPPWGGYASDPSQFFAEGAGPLVDMGVYPLQALTGLLGSARRVTALSGRSQSEFVPKDGPARDKTIPIEVDDNWQLVLELANSCLAVVDANNCVVGTRAPGLEIGGLRGTVALDILDVSAPIQVLSGGSWETIDVPASGRASGPDHLLGVEYALDCMEGRPQSELSAERAIHVVEIIEAAGRSTQEGRTQELETTIEGVAASE